MKRFSIPCDFGGKRAPFHVYIGEPNPKNHPLHFQADWLSKERGGTIPPEVMESFDKLHKISIEQGVSFEELCVYALGAAFNNNAAGAAKPAAAGAAGGAKPASGGNAVVPTPKPAPKPTPAPTPTPKPAASGDTKPSSSNK